jgi:hypothetical protein
MNAITKQELEKVGPDLSGFAKMPPHNKRLREISMSRCSTTRTPM